MWAVLHYRCGAPFDAAMLLVEGAVIHKATWRNVNLTIFDPPTFSRSQGQQEPLTAFSRLPQDFRYRPAWWWRLIADAMSRIPTVMLRRSEISRWAKTRHRWACRDLIPGKGNIYRQPRSVERAVTK
jgi:hypothetical protein